MIDATTKNNSPNHLDEIKDANGNTSLHLAVIEDNIQKIHYIVSVLKCSYVFLNRLNFFGQSAIFKVRSYEVFHYLRKAGAQWNLVTHCPYSCIESISNYFYSNPDANKKDLYHIIKKIMSYKEFYTSASFPKDLNCTLQALQSDITCLEQLVMDIAKKKLLFTGSYKNNTYIGMTLFQYNTKYFPLILKLYKKNLINLTHQYEDGNLLLHTLRWDVKPLSSKIYDLQHRNNSEEIDIPKDILILMSELDHCRTYSDAGLILYQIADFIRDHDSSVTNIFIFKYLQNIQNQFPSLTKLVYHFNMGNLAAKIYYLAHIYYSNKERHDALIFMLKSSLYYSIPQFMPQITRFILEDVISFHEALACTLQSLIHVSVAAMRLHQEDIAYFAQLLVKNLRVLIEFDSHNKFQGITTYPFTNNEIFKKFQEHSDDLYTALIAYTLAETQCAESCYYILSAFCSRDYYYGDLISMIFSYANEPVFFGEHLYRGYQHYCLSASRLKFFPNLSTFSKDTIFLLNYFLPIIHTLPQEEQIKLKTFTPKKIVYYFFTNQQQRNFYINPLAIRGRTTIDIKPIIKKIYSLVLIESQVLLQNHCETLIMQLTTKKISPLLIICTFYVHLIDNQSFEIIPKNPDLSIFVSILKNPQCDQKNLLEAFLKIDKQEIASVNFKPLFHLIFHDPEFACLFGSAIYHVKSINIAMAGWVKHNFAQVTYQFFPIKHLDRFANSIEEINDPSIKKLAYDIQTAWHTTLDPIEVKYLPEFENYSNSTHKILGRTIYIENEKKNKIHAFKIQKNNEAPDDFIRELFITNCFRADLQFASYFHVPKRIFYLKNIPRRIKKLGLPLVKRGKQLIYEYTASYDYIKYQHQLEDEKQIEHAVFAFMYDCGREIAAKSLPITCDLYHSKFDHRKYQPLIDLTTIAQYCGSTNGAGHIEQFYREVAYPNAGANGRRDVGDTMLLANLEKYPIIETPKFSKHDTIINHSDYFEISALAKIILVDAFIMLSRMKNQNILSIENERALSLAADHLKRSQIFLLQGYLNKSYQECEKFIECGVIDWELAAKQFIYWADNDEHRGYVKDINQGQLSKDLYNKNIHVEIEFGKYCPDFDPNLGFLSDGEQSFGCTSGPFACVELEKSMYWTTLVAKLYQI